MVKKTILILLLVSNLFCELPPYVYEKAKKNAQEVLVINVKDTNIHDIKNIRYINIVASIVDIKRSLNKLNKDSIITIKYSRILKKEMGWVGPSENYELEKDKIYIAYLKKTKSGYFIPDARGDSFKNYIEPLIYMKEEKIELH